MIRIYPGKFKLVRTSVYNSGWNSSASFYSNGSYTETLINLNHVTSVLKNSSRISCELQFNLTGNNSLIASFNNLNELDTEYRSICSDMKYHMSPKYQRFISSIEKRDDSENSIIFTIDSYLLNLSKYPYIVKVDKNVIHLGEPDCNIPFKHRVRTNDSSKTMRDIERRLKTYYA